MVMSPEEERRFKFQIEVLKIQAVSNVVNGFFFSIIAIGLSALISIDVNMIFRESFLFSDVLLHSFIFITIIVIGYLGWGILTRHFIEKRIENLESIFVPKRENSQN